MSSCGSESGGMRRLVAGLQPTNRERDEEEEIDLNRCALVNSASPRPLGTGLRLVREPLGLERASTDLDMLK